MKFLTSILLVLITLTGTLASPYLKNCNLIDWRNETGSAFWIQAQCGESLENATQCLDFDIIHCFANAYGTLIPAYNSHGLFNNTCGHCSFGVDKKDAAHYGLLECDCRVNKTAVHTSLRTDQVIRYESSLGLICPYNNTAARSVECPSDRKNTLNKIDFHEREVRRSLPGGRSRPLY
ncbi:uncharacterized protein BCR38DRAFT_528147 [Pseudomassariella vexata]|uniref:Cyanovirin-N domain-containing protein n=1 Tax=Pseudomassariella vexata TaxID=1141098 RepID=A0A1Y2DD75_9PEZI|nr:uncharacterized protein BCR38DRAFT_528147 [Pseudomassariella vexata]ORY57221.1 hypothetical protein BCR38DRAFT_528147 [Pseudomassariella vexata]